PAPLGGRVRGPAHPCVDLAGAAGQPPRLPRTAQRCGGAAGRDRRPEPPAQRRRARAPAAGQPRDEGAREAGRQLPRPGVEGRRAARAARARRPARPPPAAPARPGAHGRDGDDAAMPGHAFADLLLAAPPSPPSPDAADAAPVEDDAATGPDAAVPGQLLALLDGYRRDAGAPAAQAAPGGAPAGPDPAQAVGLDAAGLPAAGTAPADAGAAPAPARAAPPFAPPLVAALETAGTAHAPAIPAAAMATAPAEGETTVVES